METNNKPQERMLAYTLATEIQVEALHAVSGGAVMAGTRYGTSHDTMSGRDHTYDSNSD